MSKQPRQPPQDPPPVRDAVEDQGAYGARIDRLFRDALRDLKTLKSHPRPSEASAPRGEGDSRG